MSNRNPPSRPTVLQQNLQPNHPEKMPPQNPPEEPTPQKLPLPNASQEQKPAETPISTPFILLNSVLVELLPAKTFIRRHIAKVYVSHGVLTLLAIAQLVTFRFYDIHFYKKMGGMLSRELCLLLGIALMLILAFVGIVNTFPVNYLLAVIIVELIMLFVNCHRWMNLPDDWTFGVLAIVLVTSLLLYVIGIFVPLKFLPGVAAVMFIGILYILLVVGIVVFVYISGDPYAMRYAEISSVFYAAFIALFTVTIVHQRRFGYLAARNYLLQAAILSSIFVYLIDGISMTLSIGEHLVEHIDF